MAKVNILRVILVVVKKLNSLVFLFVSACVSASPLTDAIHIQTDGNLVTNNGAPALDRKILSLYGYEEIIENYLFDEGGKNTSPDKNYRVIFRKAYKSVLYLEIEDEYVYRVSVLTKDIPYTTNTEKTIFVGMKVKTLIDSLHEYELLHGHEAGTYITSKSHNHMSFYTDCDISLNKTNINSNSCVLNKIFIFNFKPAISWNKKK